MTQRDLIEHLQNNGCIVIREDKAGYVVMRNVITAKMSGVPVPSNGAHYKSATVCRICKTLDATIPDEATKAVGIINYIHDNPDKIK